MTTTAITFKFALGQRITRSVNGEAISGTVITLNVARDGTQGAWVEYLQNGEIKETYITEAQGDPA